MKPRDLRNIFFKTTPPFVPQDGQKRKPHQLKTIIIYFKSQGCLLVVPGLKKTEATFKNKVMCFGKILSNHIYKWSITTIAYRKCRVTVHHRTYFNQETH